ncbi:MAG: nuclear transport factor 2 family protein [Pseudomonadales bacterium]
MTIDELLDIEQIRNLRMVYGHYYDGQQVDSLVDLFTDDAICEFGPNFGGDWVGKDQIRKNFEQWSLREGVPHEVMHATTNPMVRLIDSSTAHGRAYLLDLRTKVGVDNPLILFGIYDDIYKKINGEWKIHRSRIDFLWPNREVGEARDLENLG